jgi:hypothetical protein
MSAEYKLDGWDGHIEYQIHRGLTDDEIVDLFDHMTGPSGSWEMFTRAGEPLDWGTLHGRRRIVALLATIRGTSRPRRARTVSDPRGRFHDALADLRSRKQKLTQKAVAVAMEIDRGTLNRVK